MTIQNERQSINQAPFLSDAYIRSFVRQLSSQRSKAAMSPKPLNEKSRHDSVKDLSKFGKLLPETQLQQVLAQRPQARLQQKKQVRRRLHSRKPYQQRLLNMAEARREIVAALKFHRASMKQASERQQQQEQRKQFSSLLDLPPCLLPTPGDQSFMDISIWGNLTTNLSTPAAASAHVYLSNTTSTPTPHMSNLSWSSSSISPVEIQENLSTTLPTLPLGLNLNLKSFKDIETAVTFSSSGSSPLLDLSCVTATSSSSTSSPYSFSPGALSGLEVPSALLGTAGNSDVTSEPAIDSGRHSVLETIVEELQNNGNRYHVDWNNTVNLVQSEWWHELLETMEKNSEVERERAVGGKGDGTVHEIIDFPPWSSDQLHLVNLYRDAEHPRELNFPGLDLGEMDGLDGEWIL